MTDEKSEAKKIKSLAQSPTASKSQTSDLTSWPSNFKDWLLNPCPIHSLACSIIPFIIARFIHICLNPTPVLDYHNFLNARSHLILVPLCSTQYTENKGEKIVEEVDVALGLLDYGGNFQNLVPDQTMKWQLCTAGRNVSIVLWTIFTVAPISHDIQWHEPGFTNYQILSGSQSVIQEVMLVSTHLPRGHPMQTAGDSRLPDGWSSGVTFRGQVEEDARPDRNLDRVSNLLAMEFWGDKSSQLSWHSWKRQPLLPQSVPQNWNGLEEYSLRAKAFIQKEDSWAGENLTQIESVWVFKDQLAFD